MLKFKSLQFLYRDGENDFMAITSSSLRNDKMELVINTNEDIFSVYVKAKETITIQKLCAEFEYEYIENEKICPFVRHGINDVDRLCRFVDD